MNKVKEDWSFAELSTSETLWGPHGYHRYPAKFIPQLVRRVINDYGDQRNHIGDIFLGSGTTGIEAIRAGHDFFGSDINPVACLISRAKCVPLNPTAIQRTWDGLFQQIASLSPLGRHPLSTKDKKKILSIDINHATSEERLLYWFPEKQRDILDCLVDAILQIPNESHRIFMLCAFSNILKRCSIWLSGSTKAQKDMTKVVADPVDEFPKQVRDMLRRNQLYWEDLKQSGIDPQYVTKRIQIVQQDARHLAPDMPRLDLLVTSPPYATCYEYHDLHQLTQVWFEKFSVIEITTPKNNWIGSKNVAIEDTEKIYTGSKSADHALDELEEVADQNKSKKSDIMREVRALRRYFSDMNQSITQISCALQPGKHMVLIIGDSRKRNVEIPTTEALVEMSSAVGFTSITRINRKVPGRVLVSTRDRQSGRFSSTAESDVQAYPEENILVFKRL